jgi:hypothetical protein
MKSRALFVLACLVLIVVLLPGAARAQEPARSIRDAMSPAEFHHAGLDKLSPEELRNLDRWLQGDREKTAQQAAKAAERTTRAKIDVIVSRVNGTFGGLNGHTIITLEDGTRWKQANADDRFRGTSTDHPGAAVVHGLFGYKMRVEGVPEFYVNPVRQ